MRIKALREQKGIKQKDLALQLGIAPNTLSQYENGKREPDLATIKKMAEVLSVSADELLGSEEKTKKLTTDKDDDELDEYLEVLKNRSECRMLFSLAKDATKEDVEKAVAIIEALRKTEGR